MDFSLGEPGCLLLKALNWSIHNGYDGSTKVKPGCLLGMTGRDFAVVMAQTGSQWCDSDICTPVRQALLQMPESKDH